MTALVPRFDDQDVAALYCAMRDGICVAGALTWRQRLADFLFPARAAARRLAAIEVVYRTWQEARPMAYEEIAPLSTQATAMALHMVRSQRAARDFAVAKSVEVR